MSKPLAVLLTILISASCTRKPAATIGQLSSEFIYSTLAFSPVAATGIGYHEHNGVRLDEQLDDYSAESLDKQRQFYHAVRDRLGRDFRPDQLSPEDRADYDIVSDQVALSLLELDDIQGYRHNPTIYVELIGNALFNPSVLEYTLKARRYRHIIARLEKIPAFLETAKKNLVDAPEVWNKVAQEENDGNIGLVDKMLRDGAPPETRADYDKAAAPALDALRGFNKWLKDDLSRRAGDWRLGKDKYARKFKPALGIDATPEQVLADAEAKLKEIRKEMFDLSLPLHHKWYPTHKDPVDLNLIVTETLNKIAGNHAEPEDYMAAARRDLEEARRFVREKKLLTLPARDNLQVIETPEFMRGVYGVGGFNPAPAFEPQLGAFYWITPIPPAWPKERVESKLREYNYYNLKILTIHEAMPGHYVQLEYSNDVQPKERRVLRAVFGSGPYVEGWAVYATEMMLDAGYLDNSVEMRLTYLKQQLRVLANTIMDVRMQTMGMTDEQAMDLMLNSTFQEKEEATAKLQRTKLTSTQLPTYYVGWRDWMRIRQEYKARQGSAFQLSEFHERALKQSAVPMRDLGRLLGL